MKTRRRTVPAMVGGIVSLAQAVLRTGRRRSFGNGNFAECSSNEITAKQLSFQEGYIQPSLQGRTYTHKDKNWTLKNSSACLTSAEKEENQMPCQLRNFPRRPNTSLKTKNSSSGTLGRELYRKNSRKKSTQSISCLCFKILTSCSLTD